MRELGGVAQSYEFAVKHNAASVEGRSQTFEKQATIAAGENVNRNKEVRFACDPAPVRSEAAARHDAVNMGMMGKGLSPCVRDRDHSGLGAQMFGVGGDDADRLGGRLEQDIVDERLVLESQRRDRRRHGEYDVEIGNGQQLHPAISEPLEPRQPLTLRTVSIATRIVGDAWPQSSQRST